MEKRAKWTEIEYLPEWDEEFYDVYTAKKYGKWTMLKTLKPKWAADPRMRGMIEKEFEVRYNLAHPNIVMINDYEEVPGLGMCIITDDVYGESLRKIIDSGKVTPHHIDALRRQLVDALDYIQTNHIVHHPIRPETIIFTDKVGNLKLIDVGFDQHDRLEPAEAVEDIAAFGRVVTEALDARPDLHYPRLRRVAQRCTGAIHGRELRDVAALRLALADRRGREVYLWVVVFLAVMAAVLAAVMYNS